MWPLLLLSRQPLTAREKYPNWHSTLNNRHRCRNARTPKNKAPHAHSVTVLPQQANTAAGVVFWRGKAGYVTPRANSCIQLKLFG